MVKYNAVPQPDPITLAGTVTNQYVSSAKDKHGNIYVPYVTPKVLSNFGLQITKIDPSGVETVFSGPDNILSFIGNSCELHPDITLTDDTYIYVVLGTKTGGNFRLYVRRLDGGDVITGSQFVNYEVDVTGVPSFPAIINGAVVYNKYLYVLTNLSSLHTSLIAIDLSGAQPESNGKVGVNSDALSAYIKITYNWTGKSDSPAFLQLVDNLIISCDITTGLPPKIWYYDPAYSGSVLAEWPVALDLSGSIPAVAVTSMIVDNPVTVEYNNGSLFRYYNIFIGTGGTDKGLYKIPFNGSSLQIDSSNIVANIGPAQKIGTLPAALTNAIIPSRYNVTMYSIYLPLPSLTSIQIDAITDFDPHPCFLEGTEILTDKGYVLIQDLRAGDKVKTVNSGFVPIFAIGKRGMAHLATEERIKDQLYVCSPSNYPELTKDLVLTGCHSLLVPRFVSEEQALKTREILGANYVTDGHYRLPACVDDRATVYPTKGVYPIYHFALDHEDRYVNYGVYANGLLVETTSKRYMLELSGMTLLE